MSLNSLWFQKYQPSKLNDRKNVRFSTKTDIFFDRSILMARIFGTSGSSETYCTSFERSYRCLKGARSLRAWQYFYLVPRPFEKGHFTPYRGNNMVNSLRIILHSLLIMGHIIPNLKLNENVSPILHMYTLCYTLHISYLSSNFHSFSKPS